LLKPVILDNLSEIKRIDKSDMLSFCVGAPKHYGDASRLAKNLQIDYHKPETIIVAGMGGSAIGGELLKDWARDKADVPIEVCRDYSLPAYAGRNALVFVVSYSGETEEALSVFQQALKRKCMIVTISSGGKLQEFSKKLSLPHVQVPLGMAPRATLPYLFLPLPFALKRLGLVSNVDSEVNEAVRVLKLVSDENMPGKPLSGNFSKTLASALDGTVPVIYGFGFYRAVAQRLKTQFNENSKVPAKWEFFPELNHNEIVGWENAKKLGEYFSLVFIRDSDEPEEIQRRIEITKKLVHDEGLRAYEIWGRGRSVLARMCSVICIGDFTSVYLGILRAVDPTPVRTIDVLKRELAKSGFKNKVIRELETLVKK